MKRHVALTPSPLARGAELKRGPGPSRTAPLNPSPWSAPPPSGRTREKGKSAARTRSGSGRGESFPPAVAALIDARDPWCVKCGSPNDLHRHHRRIKGSGGDSRPHTDCACDGVRLCARCHLDWAHSGNGRREAETEGLIIPRAETGPWRRPLMLHTAADSGAMVWPTCDGRYVTEMPEGALAA